MLESNRLRARGQAACTNREVSHVPRASCRELSVRELPITSAHTARLVALEPPHNAVHMERMLASAPHQWTIISWHLAVDTEAIEWHSTDAAALVVHLPLPRAYCSPSIHPTHHRQSINHHRYFKYTQDIHQRV